MNISDLNIRSLGMGRIITHQEYHYQRCAENVLIASKCLADKIDKDAMNTYVKNTARGVT